MSVNTETTPAQGNTTVLENTAGDSVYTSLFKKINLTPASRLGDINDFLDDSALAEASTSERLTAAMQVFLNCIRQSGQNVDKLDKTLIDHHIAELDYQISRQLDAVMHHDEFQKVESLWRGLKQLVDNTDYRQNVKTEILDVSKDDLRQDFDDAPELIQSGLYWHTYTAEYDTPARSRRPNPARSGPGFTTSGSSTGRPVFICSAMLRTSRPGRCWSRRAMSLPP